MTEYILPALPPGGIAGQVLDKKTNADFDAQWISVGTAARPATVTVAAFNSLHHAAGDADFICSGANDDITIQAAVNAVLASPRQVGTVLLLDGDYNIGAGTAGINGNDNVSIRGMGGFGANFGNAAETSINLPAAIGNNIVVLGRFESISDLAVIGGFALNAVNLQVINASEVRSVCVFMKPMVGGGSGFGIIQSAAEPLIIGNLVNCGAGWEGIVASGLVTGNFVGRCDVGIDLGSNTEARDNWLFFCQQGLTATGTDSIVQNNRFQSCGDAAHDALYVRGQGICVQGNVVRRNLEATRYGINVDAGSNAVLVVMNDLRASAAVSSFNDAGAGTIINLDGSLNNWNRL